MDIETIINILHFKTSISKDKIIKCLPTSPDNINVLRDFISKNYAMCLPSVWFSYKYTNSERLLAKYMADISKFENKIGEYENVIEYKNFPFKVSTKKSTPEIYRLATYNVHFWLSPIRKNNIDSILKFMKDLNIDIIGIQEAILPIPETMKDKYIDLLGYQDEIQPMDSTIPMDGGNIISTDGWERKNIYEDIRNMDYRYISQVGASTTHSGKNSYFGNAILSNQKIAKSQGLTLDSYGQGRGAALAYYENILDSGLLVVSVHLDVFDGTGAARLKQIKQLLDFIDKYYTNIPIILMGDFNSLKLSDYTDKERLWLNSNNQGDLLDFETVRIIEDRGYKDTFDVKSIKFSTWTGRRVDYIFTRYIPKENIVSTYTYYSTDSDHIPLIVDIKLI